MMNLKSVTTGIATAALVGALGLAYAQSSTDAPPASGTDALQQVPPSDASTPQALPNDSAAATPSAPSSSGDMSSSTNSSEPAPRADRG